MTDREIADGVIGFLKSIVEQEYPGTIIDYDMRYYSDAAVGFGVACEGGLLLIYADLTTQPWWLLIDSCVVADMQEVDAALQWVNAKNRNIAVGKYYCARARKRGLAAIVNEMSFLGDVLHTAFYNVSGPAQSSLVGWVIGCIRNSISTSAKEGAELCSLYGGRRLAATEKDLTMLFAMASG